MSIKKYHKSANLFDKNSESVEGYITDAGTIAVGGNPITTYDYIAVNDSAISYKAFSAGPYEHTTIRVAFYDANKNFLSRSVAINGAMIGQKVFLPVGCSFVRLSVDDNLNDVMLVKGSTPPTSYEPYDPEVWHSVPYHKYGTETDAITTLPTTVIGDGTPISSYIIKGNMEQTGTPTPENPIYPSECGDLVASGEHAGQYKLPLTLGGTTTDIYLGEVQSTRRIKKLVLTGEEGWTRTSNERCYYINSAKGCPGDYLKSNIITVICSHYAGQINTGSGSNDVNEGCVCFFTGGGNELYIGERTITSAIDFKAYLAQQYANGTPVTVWYVLKGPETGIVNEPLMKIGNYVDSVSGTNLATSGTAQGLNVETTLKPSEVDLTYHGWHKHDDTKYST